MSFLAPIIKLILKIWSLFEKTPQEKHYEEDQDFKESVAKGNVDDIATKLDDRLHKAKDSLSRRR